MQTNGMDPPVSKQPQLGQNGFKYKIIQQKQEIRGALKHNGPPGWKIIIRGLEKLLQIQIGCKLLQEAKFSYYSFSIHIERLDLNGAE